MYFLFLPESMSTLGALCSSRSLRQTTFLDFQVIPSLKFAPLRQMAAVLASLKVVLDISRFYKRKVFLLRTYIILAEDMTVIGKRFQTFRVF